MLGTLRSALRCLLVHLRTFLVHNPMLLELAQIFRQSMIFDIARRGERVDMHAAQPDDLDVRTLRLLKLDRNVSLHTQHVGDFHRAT